VRWQSTPWPTPTRAIKTVKIEIRDAHTVVEWLETYSRIVAQRFAAFNSYFRERFLRNIVYNRTTN
jgi:hypothetical protein